MDEQPAAGETREPRKKIKAKRRMQQAEAAQA